MSKDSIVLSQKNPRQLLRFSKDSVQQYSDEPKTQFRSDEIIRTSNVLAVMHITMISFFAMVLYGRESLWLSALLLTIPSIKLFYEIKHPELFKLKMSVLYVLYVFGLLCVMAFDAAIIPFLFFFIFNCGYRLHMNQHPESLIGPEERDIQSEILLLAGKEELIHAPIWFEQENTSYKNEIPLEHIEQCKTQLKELKQEIENMILEHSKSSTTTNTQSSDSISALLETQTQIEELLIKCEQKREHLKIKSEKEYKDLNARQELKLIYGA